MTAALRRVGPAVVIASGLVMMIWSWGKWPDMMIDFGRELYVPWQLAAGKMLYVDIAYFHGPLSPYFNAAVFSVTGPGLLYLVVANLLVLGVIAVLMYRALDRLCGPIAAVTGGVVFMTTFAFAHPIAYGGCNFVTPYSHEMTHGSLLALIAMTCAWRFLESGRTTYLWCVGSCLGLVFLTKPEFLIAAGPAVVVAVVLAGWTRREPAAATIGSVARIAAAAIVVIALAAVVLSAGIGPARALRGVFGSWPDLVNPALRTQHFYRVGLGTADPTQSVRDIVAWSTRFLVFLAPATAAAWFLRKPGAARIVTTAGLCLAGVIPLWVYRARLPWSEIGSPFPFVIAVVAAVLIARVVRDRRAGSYDGGRIAAVMFVMYSGALLLKMAFNTRIHHYGFALALPAAMVITATLVQGIPRWIDSRGGYGWGFRAIASSAIGVTVAVYLTASATVYGGKTHVVSSGPDAFKADSRAEVVNRMVARIGTTLGPDETLAVLAEGVMLNYLARRANSTPYINFMPPELIIYGEARVLEAYRSSPPDYIVVTNRSARDYGYRILGRGYGEALMTWVQDNYRMVETIEGSDPSRAGDEFTYLLFLERTAD